MGFAAVSTNDVDTWPIEIQAVGSNVLIYRRHYANDPRHYANDPWDALSREMRELETALERKRRLARERTKAAIRSVRLDGLPLLPSVYVRPRRRGRACGSRHRVLLG